MDEKRLSLLRYHFSFKSLILMKSLDFQGLFIAKWYTLGMIDMPKQQHLSRDNKGWKRR
jgi:hypothetical protein